MRCVTSSTSRPPGAASSSCSCTTSERTAPQGPLVLYTYCSVRVNAPAGGCTCGADVLVWRPEHTCRHKKSAHAAASAFLSSQVTLYIDFGQQHRSGMQGDVSHSCIPLPGNGSTQHTMMRQRTGLVLQHTGLLLAWSHLPGCEADQLVALRPVHAWQEARLVRQQHLQQQRRRSTSMAERGGSDMHCMG
jgi:hypothetical protein